MKIVLNPEYKFLQQFVQDLPTRFASEGKVIQDKRNTIKVFEYKELEINVKRYRVPILIKIKSGQSLFQLFRSPETGV